jgi:hypothetical protein
MPAAEIVGEKFDPLGEFYHDSAIKMQAFIAFAARKFGSYCFFPYFCSRNQFNHYFLNTTIYEKRREQEQ